MNDRTALKFARHQFGPAASILPPDKSDPNSTGLHYIFVPAADDYDYWGKGLYPLGFGDSWDQAITNAVRHCADLERQGRASRQCGEFIVVASPARVSSST